MLVVVLPYMTSVGHLRGAYTLTLGGESRGGFRDIAARIRGKQASQNREWCYRIRAGRLEIEDALTQRLEIRDPDLDAGNCLPQVRVQQRSDRRARAGAIDADEVLDLF